ncbi:hypothetical protein JCM8547_007537 [Rhodosporidiobolus lusitaniae]
MLLSRGLPRLSPTSLPSPSSLLAHRSMSSSSSLRKPVSLLTPSQLAPLFKKDSKVKCFDASWFMPGVERDGFREWRKCRVPHSGFWHLDQISSDSDVGVPHNIPSKELFEDACSRLGIERDDHVVFYDTHGVFSSPRAAFTFHHFSHPLISILDGGLPRWQAEGYPVTTTTPVNPNPHKILAEGEEKERYQGVFSELLYATKPRVESYFIADIEELFTDYKVPEGAELSDVRQFKDVMEVLEKEEGEGRNAAVVDARPEGRFTGSSAEPRPGLSSGHMPGAFNVPSPAVLSEPTSTEPSYKTLKSPEELEGVFKNALGEEQWKKVKEGERPVLTSCGSGMTAAIVWLALQRTGVTDNVSIYDESWTGYAQRPEAKIVKD